VTTGPHLLAAGLLALLPPFLGAAPLTDLITLKGGATLEGTFEEYRNGRFHFQPDGGGKLLQEARTTVEDVELRPPAKVIVKPQGHKEIEDLSLKGYGNGEFVFERNGQPVRMRGSDVSAIRLGLDFDRARQRQAASPPAKTGGAFDPAKLAKPGVVTVVHFHMDGVLASVKAGGYIEQLAADSHGKVVVSKIVLTGTDAPEATACGIASVPQFWFYSRTGALVLKLTDRFTPMDIEQALKEARR
jgi:hypothetical protein